MLKLLKKTLFIDSSLALSTTRRRTYVTVLVVVVVLHLIGIVAVALATGYRNSINSPDPYAYFSTLLGIVSVASGLLIVLLSLKSEALISQTYEFAVGATQAASHEFKEFRAHLAWLKDNLSPERYPDVQHLFFSVSTPLYGIGADQCADDFLEFFESWVNHFENMNSSENAHPPRWDFSVWNQDDNISTFGRAHFPWDSGTNKQALARFEELLGQVYELHRQNRLDFRLYFTDVSHARLFMAQTGSQRFGGLVVLFSPLTPSSIKTVQWVLIGFSFRDEQAFRNISRFNLKLQKRDHTSARPDDQVQELQNPSEWLRRHYGLDPHK